MCTVFALSRVLGTLSCALGHDTAQPAQPYHNIRRLCRDTKRENFVSTRKTLSRQEPLKNIEEFVALVCAPLSRHKDCVATQPTQQLSPPVATPKVSIATQSKTSLSRQGVFKETCRDRPSHACLRARRPSVVCIGAPTVHAVAPAVATPQQCRDPKLEMGSSPPHSLP